MNFSTLLITAIKLLIVIKTWKKLMITFSVHKICKVWTLSRLIISSQAGLPSAFNTMKTTTMPLREKSYFHKQKWMREEQPPI